MLSRIESPKLVVRVAIYFSSALVSIISSSFGFAEENVQWAPPQLIGRIALESTSPIRTKARYVLIGGSALTLAAMTFRRGVIEPLDNELHEDRPLGSWSRAGDVLGQLVPNLVYSLANGGLYLLSRDSRSLKRAETMVKATAYSGALALALKSTVREGRPYDRTVRTSFPSGHTTTTFAFASVVAMEHEWYWGMAAYGLATFVGVSRINDHQHHTHDVLAGATIGMSYGLGLFYHSNASAELAKESHRSSLVAVLPGPDLDGTIVSVTSTY